MDGYGERILKLPNNGWLMAWQLKVLRALVTASAFRPDSAVMKRDILRKWPNTPARHWPRLHDLGLVGMVKSAESGRMWEFYITAEGRKWLDCANQLLR
jgi:hypothetical protein